MKRLAIATCLAAAVVVAGCGDDNPTGPSNQPTIFTVQLRAANEVPPVANAESGAGGTAVITVTPNRDSAGTITGSSISPRTKKCSPRTMQWSSPSSLASSSASSEDQYAGASA